MGSAKNLTTASDLIQKALSASDSERTSAVQRTSRILAARKRRDWPLPDILQFKNPRFNIPEPDGVDGSCSPAS